MSHSSSSFDSKQTTGKLVVLSGPGGVGKTTLMQGLLDRVPNLRRTVTVTTRARREGEVVGEDYFFISQEEFEARIESGEFLEYAKVYNRDWYGTPKSAVESAIAAGKTVLLVIDVEGALNVKEQYPDALLIFLLPPSIEVLKNRLHARGHDSEDAIVARLAVAKQEIATGQERYDYRVVNDDLDTAIAEVERIISTY